MFPRVRYLVIAVGFVLTLLSQTNAAAADSYLGLKSGVSTSPSESIESPGFSLGGALLGAEASAELPFTGGGGTSDMTNLYLGLAWGGNEF